jgi:very-short-patch-repair endonuclease
MRFISKRTSTKAERIFIEILKANHIQFKYHVKLEDREIDFIIEHYAIEIDGHRQSAQKNDWILSNGYVPIHYTNYALLKNRSAVEQDITNRYHGLFTSRNRTTT